MYLKPRRHRSPVITAEYLNGEKHWMSLHNSTVEEVRRLMIRLEMLINVMLRLEPGWTITEPAVEPSS